MKDFLIIMFLLWMLAAIIFAAGQGEAEAIVAVAILTVGAIVGVIGWVRARIRKKSKKP